MKCPNCKNEIELGILICKFCGKNLSNDGFSESIVDKFKKSYLLVKPFIELHGPNFYNDFFSVTDIVVNTLRIVHKKTQYQIIQKEVTEKIAREILNNSNILKEHQPFSKPKNESNGEDDNIGVNLNIDTKLLLFNQACYELSKNQRAIIDNQKEFEFIFNIIGSYDMYKNNEKPRDQLETNHFSMIKEIELKLNKYRHKNLLFIYPFPLQDLFFLNDGTFRMSYVGNIFCLFNKLKLDVGYKNRLFFTYPLINNEYNLVEIADSYFISDALIESFTQKKYMPIVDVGIFNRTKKIFLPYKVKLNYKNPHVTKINFK